MYIRKAKTYSQYQLDKILEDMENNYEKQWNEKIQDIKKGVLEQVKVDVWTQYMSVAMAVLEKYHNFTEEQLTQFYNNCISIMNIMESASTNNLQPENSTD